MLKRYANRAANQAVPVWSVDPEMIEIPLEGKPRRYIRVAPPPKLSKSREWVSTQGIPYFLITLMAILLTLLFLLSCNRSGSDQPEFDPKGKPVIHFNTVADPGHWEAQASDHEPEIRLVDEDDGAVMYVTVPFTKTRNPNHYLEVVLLLDANKKEIAKKEFERGSGREGARFVLPEGGTSGLSVVAKCNLHDMWIKPVSEK